MSTYGEKWVNVTCIFDMITIRVFLCVLSKFADSNYSQKVINAMSQTVIYRKIKFKGEKIGFKSRTFWKGLYVKDGVSKIKKNVEYSIVHVFAWIASQMHMEIF